MLAALCSFSLFTSFIFSLSPLFCLKIILPSELVCITLESLIFFTAEVFDKISNCSLYKPLPLVSTNNSACPLNAVTYLLPNNNETSTLPPFIEIKNFSLDFIISS